MRPFAEAGVGGREEGVSSAAISGRTFSKPRRPTRRHAPERLLPRFAPLVFPRAPYRRGAGASTGSRGLRARTAAAFGPIHPAAPRCHERHELIRLAEEGDAAAIAPSCVSTSFRGRASSRPACASACRAAPARNGGLGTLSRGRVTSIIKQLCRETKQDLSCGELCCQIVPRVNLSKVKLIRE